MAYAATRCALLIPHIPQQRPSTERATYGPVGIEHEHLKIKSSAFESARFRGIRPRVWGCGCKATLPIVLCLGYAVSGTPQRMVLSAYGTGVRCPVLT
eukprot:1777301-Rhodomonas_salina.5